LYGVSVKERSGNLSVKPEATKERLS
jgi:hypothetical protein